jgi:hypothetical protein
VMHRRVHARGMGRRRITGHRRTLRSDNASYARALELDRAHNLSRLRDETGIASDRFKAGNDRNASPGELDFMYRGLTRGMKAHVSTMLTESGLSIPLPVRDFKHLVRRNGRCKTTSTAFRVLFVLTMRVAASGLQTKNAGHVARYGTGKALRAAWCP